VLEGFYPHRLIRIELSPDAVFDREHKAQVREAVPSLECSKTDIVRDCNRIAVDGLGEQSLCLQICAHLVSLPRICCHSVLVSPNSYWSSLELSEAETLCARNVASWRQPCAL